MRVRLVMLAALATAGASAPALAQVAGVASGGTVPGCTYDACALRRERVFFSERLLAGVQGTVVGRPRFFGTLPIDSLVRAVPEARPYARTYRVEQTRGQVLTFVGTVLSVAALIDAANNSQTCVSTVGVVFAACSGGGFNGRNTALLVGGAVLGGVGGWRLQVSDRALNRAVWWYNRALTR